MAYLTGISGVLAGKRYDISREKATLGRHPSCDIWVESDSFSRTHCEFDHDERGCFVADCDSRNHTYLNDRQLEPFRRYYLKNGDRVVICGSTFELSGIEGKGEQDSSNPLSSQVLIEDVAASDNSTIMSQLDVSADSQRAHISASPLAKLKALIEITQALSRTLSLDEVLPKALDSLFEIFTQADRGFVVLQTPAGELVPRWTKVRRRELEESLRMSRTIIKDVLQSRRAILSRDLKTDDRWPDSHSVVFECTMRSMMCAPLLNGEGTAIGVLQLDVVNSTKPFGEDDLEVLTTVALQAGIAIDNAQMHETALRQREIERDLEVAQQVQNGFLPESPPRIANYDFFHYYRPAHHVGGDYFDYVELPNGRWAIVVADVVGHGVAAALMMAKLSTEFRAAMAWEANVGTALTRLNRAMVGLQLDRFATMVLLMLDPPSGQLSIANAGHPPPLLRKADGRVLEIGSEAANVPVGLFADIEYEFAETVIEPDEALVMWTDGIHESMNEEFEELGIERLITLLADISPGELSAETIGACFIEAANAHRDEREPDDDMCLVAFTRSDQPATKVGR